jgi:hypothetical protein
MDTKCPNQVFYYWLLLNRGGKRNSHQIMIFVYVCSTYSIADVTTGFEAGITRNDVNSLS